MTRIQAHDMLWTLIEAWDLTKMSTLLQLMYWIMEAVWLALFS